jgi:glycosyltransferase involved in cell wall biosynthesis
MKASPQPPCRVLRLITRLNVGGPARHVAWLQQKLDPARFAQTLAAGRVPPGEDDLGPELRAQGLAWRDLPRLGRPIDPRDDLAALGEILRLLVEIKPHVVCSHGAKAGMLGRSAVFIYRPLAALAGWPRPRCVHTFHGHTFHSYFSPAQARLFLGLERFLARWATWRVVALSPRQRRELVETYRVSAAWKTVLVPLGVDLEPFARPEAGRRRFRAELGVPEDKRLVGAVGRVAPVKNYGLFLRTAAALRQARPELFARCRFVLVGGGDEAAMAALRGQARELGLEERVRFLGSRADREAFFPGLDLLLMTSNNEGTPMAILEGGACGLPVVATGVGGVPDLLGPAERELGGGLTQRARGITAPKGDALALARGLALLLDQDDQAKRLGEALRRYVWQNHAKARLAGDMADLYDRARD